MTNDITATLRDAWRQLEDLILDRAPSHFTDLWSDANQAMQETIRKCATLAAEERRRSFGHGWEEGRAVGQREGWQDRDRTAREELATKQGEINGLTANLIAARELALRGPVTVNAEGITSGEELDAIIRVHTETKH